jgi:hypothetical protein
MEVRLKCRITSPRIWPRSTTGMTENISRSGVLVRWDECSAEPDLPGLGEPVTLEIELPANHSFVRKCIYCQAIVVRIASHDEPARRMAMSVSQMEFRDSSNGLPVLEELEIPCDSWAM